VNVSELTKQDKRELLTLARKTIDYGLRNQRVPEASELGVTISEAMKRPRAAFVTLKKISVLKKDDKAEPQKILRLRGCIGDIFPQRPLYKSVLMNAIYAAFRDRRFTPLQRDEFDDIVIEVSALTAPRPVSSYKQIRIGIDGVVLRKEGKSAVFLPQVAPEQGWDLEQTLTHLSQKAGLSEDAWKEGASFLVFEGDVFGENHE
jgi:AmmeMemoRadiSam system protein A